MALKAGDRIDRYTLLAPIGEGGQGSVWRVLDPLDGGVERALKLVSTSALSPDASERARREARALASAPHPNLITCHGLFEDVGTGLVGLVLELVEGRPLHEVADDPRMSDEHKNALLLQLAEALAHIHEVEIVHRDLKPDNVLITESFWLTPRLPGAIKLVDFGIAVRLGNPRPLTQVGEIVGTPPYLAPEAIVPSVAPDAATGYARDIFAFGILAFELYTGRHPTGLPVDATPAEFVVAYARAASSPEPWPPDVLPLRWTEPIAKCLSIDAASRPASGLELLELVIDLSSLPTAPRDSARPTREMGFSAGESDPILSIEPATEPAPAGPEGDSAPEPPAKLGKPPPTIPDWSPPPPGPRPATPPPRSGRGLVGVLLVLLLLGAAVFMVSRRGMIEPSAGPPVSTVSVPLPVKRPPPAPSACPATCCGGLACLARPENARGCAPEGGHCRACASDRACIPGACDARIAADGVWLLRVAGVTANGKDVIPRPRVCLRHGGAGNDAWVCPPAGGHDAGAPRLRVTTAELTHGGIDLSVARADGPAAIGVGVHHAAIGVAALCRGLNFRFTSEGTAHAVTLFLDDGDDDAPP